MASAGFGLRHSRGVASWRRDRIGGCSREPPSSAPIAALARSVLFEQALGFAVLAVVSVLGTWPPAIHHHGG
jgi:hypothetical protein